MSFGYAPYRMPYVSLPICKASWNNTPLFETGGPFGSRRAARGRPARVVEQYPNHLDRQGKFKCTWTRAPALPIPSQNTLRSSRGAATCSCFLVRPY
eukprot:2020879-Prymnesium_polylepis.1